MLRQRLARFAVVLVVLIAARPLHAQEVATLALRSGERPSGELIDLNAGGFLLRVNGQERTFPAAQVAAVEFVVGPVPAEAQARIDAGQPFVLLRSGQMVEGRLSDVGGTHPLRITIETAAGARDFTSNDVAKVYVNPVARSAGAGGQPVPSSPSGIVISVPAAAAWTDTRIPVGPGRRLRFIATGDIMLSSAASSGPGGSPAATVPTVRYPLPGAPAGALIGRVGDGPPFLIGVNTQPIQMRSLGLLRLGVNDDHVADNSGSFQVTVTQVN